ncbi:hypothetical protein HY085_00140 [Candidatus Gottesmanbacteria bacterium]|nr:hypothetical protein [Candidatus Gottesmanbacteria bacterium]
MQKAELGKVALDAGKITFLGTSAAYFLSPLTEQVVTFSVFLGGLVLSLIFLIVGIILLGKDSQQDERFRYSCHSNFYSRACLGRGNSICCSSGC